MKKRSKTYFTTKAKHLGIFSKIIIIVLVIGMLISHINFAAFAAMMPKEMNNVETTEDVTRDLSKLKRIEEIEYLRTLDSKTYLKENGLLETDVYGEIIHYLENGVYKEIDNTLELINNTYVNKANSYLFSLPKVLDNNKKISLKYKDKEIKLYYDYINIQGILQNSISRNKTNLKDEISYQISNNEKLQYILKQNSIKENIILNSYVENYSYSYFIDTLLRLERIGNEIHFFDGLEEVFVMNEYYMFDANKQESNDIDFDIEVIDSDTYKITVTPSDAFLSRATYPVVIDPEITLTDGGLIDGITSLYSIDKAANTNTFLTLGSFSLANRNASISTDDLIANLHVYIPREYTTSVGNIITRNQLMYASITLTTISTNATSDTKVKMKYDGNIIDEVTFHNTSVFNHKFNIIDALNEKIEAFATNDIYMSFELYLDGASNTEVTYSLGWDLGGDKPLITLGYLDDAGLSDYYTYEELPLDNESSIYLAHNSGNLTYLFNDYTDNNLLNLSHIYNANRKYNESIYGNGFNISYNEKLTQNYSNIILTLGSGRNVIFYPTNQNKTEYIATDGSGDTLIKKFNQNNEIIGYEIASGGGIKLYNSIGKLTKIYVDESERVDGIWNTDAKQITLLYSDNNVLEQVIDSYGNQICFTYSTIANDPSDSQVGIPYLLYVEVYKMNNEHEICLASRLEFEYMQGALIAIGNYKNSSSAEYTYFNYNSKGHIERIYKNGNGYNFTYDNKNRVLKAKIYSSSFTNGDYIDFIYSKNGKKTIVTTGTGQKTTYTFDSYYHTNSIEDSNGYTTFYKYEDIYFDENGNTITSPNYKKNHAIKVQSNSFKNVINPIVNHGFEVITSGSIYGWAANITNGSRASIETDSYLYGSKVLKLYKSTSGIAQVYQDIDVKNGTEYIVTGYIKNVNNNGTGAYIDISGINGTISTIQKSGNIKNSKDFYKFEYKFKANYTGKARITLVNASVGSTYFDNIQVNTNYIDTRYNYLENSSFENSTIGAWSGANYSIISNNDKFNENCGSKSLKLLTNGTISQTINSPGLKGDTFVFGGYALYANYTGNVTIRLTLVKENGIETNVFTFENSDINASYMMARITATENYQSIKLEITNNSSSSYAYLDNLAIYKEGYGINLTYNDDGYVTEEHNEITDSTTTYKYDNECNITQIVTNNDETNYTYDSNNYLNTIENQNIVTTINTDSNGNIEDITLTGKNQEIGYFYGSTTYTQDGLYPKTETNVFGKVTTYTYDYLTSLVTQVIDPNGVATDYTYDSDGNVIKIVNGKNNNKKTIIYNYDKYGNILTITNGDSVYTFTYNDYGDLKTIYIGDALILTNNYKNENSTSNIYTGELVESIYSYGTISLEYNENHQVSKIYNGTGSSKYVVLEYTYNDYGEIASYTDYKENVTYYYNYDYENKLINVNATNGNNITYTYDENSNLISKRNINGTNNYIYNDLNSDEDIENNKLINEFISDKFTINYEYTNDSYKQLEIINYYINTLPIEGKYTYETTINPNDNKTYYTGRIKELEYINGSNQIIKYEYVYDDYSNISKIYGYTNNVQVYYEENYYDNFNQLTAQMIEIGDEIIVSEYGYDTRGNNIGYYSYNQTTGESLNSAYFSYNNKDEIIQATLNGQNYNITYSSVGHPNIYLGWTIDYDMRNICVIENDEYYVEYYYNANGIRIGKSIDKGTTIESVNYILNGNNIIKETHIGTNNYTIEYYYDSSENIIGFTYNGNKYLYLKNLQNDIVGIIDSNNNLVVKYYYDAYGRIIKTYDTSSISLSTINPFRYRSYYQDNETEWYYLNSRYYNPLTNRFITMDQIEYLGANQTIQSNNLYIYCENNPIMFIDSNGNLAKNVMNLVNAINVNSVFAMYASLIYASLTAGLAKVSAYVTGILLPKITSLFWWKPIVIVGIVVAAVAIVVTAVIIIYNNSISSSISQIGGIAKSYPKERYQCKDAAIAMKNVLIKKKQHGALIKLTFANIGLQHIFTDKTGDFPISKNGVHWGLLFEGKVYCTIYPEGLPESLWILSFYSAYGDIPIVTKYPF